MLSHRTHLTGSHLTLMGTGAERRPDRAKPQHSLGHARVVTRGKPCQAGLLSLPAHMKSRVGGIPPTRPQHPLGSIRSRVRGRPGKTVLQHSSVFMWTRSGDRLGWARQYPLAHTSTRTRSRLSLAGLSGNMRQQEQRLW